jgi:hypothetical protein
MEAAYHKNLSSLPTHLTEATSIGNNGKTTFSYNFELHLQLQVEVRKAWIGNFHIL